MATLTFPQIERLWIDNGGSPSAAPIMAAIAIAESGGRTDAHNGTGRDDSWGLFQINYFGGLSPGRTAAYGTPAQLVADPNRQAKAAISISGNGKNLSPWTTYPTAAQAVLRSQGAALPTITALPSLTSPAATQGAASVDNEGLLFKIHIPATDFDVKMERGTARKMIGAVVLVGGGVVGLAGVFVLVGSKTSLPGVGGVAQKVKGIPAARKAGRQEEAEVLMQAKGRRREAEEKTMAAAAKPTSDELAERRRRRAREQRERGREIDQRSARAQGEADAATAGSF